MAFDYVSSSGEPAPRRVLRSLASAQCGVVRPEAAQGHTLRNRCAASGRFCLKKFFARHLNARRNLTIGHVNLGQIDKAKTEAKEPMELDPSGEEGMWRAKR